MIMIHWATHNQSLLSSPTRPQHGWTLQMWVQFWGCWSGGLPSKTWPTPGWGPPEARLPTPASWTGGGGGRPNITIKFKVGELQPVRPKLVASFHLLLAKFWNLFDRMNTSLVYCNVWCLVLESVTMSTSLILCLIIVWTDYQHQPFSLNAQQCRSPHLQVTLTTRITESSVTMWSRPQESSPPKNFGNTQKVSRAAHSLSGHEKSLEHCIYW